MARRRDLIDMRLSDIMYHFPRMVERLIERIQGSKICDANKRGILEFHDHIITMGLSLARQAKYLGTLRLIAERMNKRFDQVTKEDAAGLVRWLETSEYCESTKNDYKVVFKIFFRWLKRTEDYPDEVAWIRPRARKQGILPEQLVSKADLEKLAAAAFNPRDRAFVLVLFDSGCRIGEVLSLRIKNVSLDQYGAQLIVTGKTGSRRVRIIASVPALCTWLANHPTNQTPD